jgi:hypothetical protein
MPGGNWTLASQSHPGHASRFLNDDKTVGGNNGRCDFVSGIVLSLCDRTGNAVRPWAAAGWECWCVDVQHDGDTTRDGIRFIREDVRRFLPPKDIAIVFAFPPCTNLAVSGARWFKEKGLYGLAEGLDLVARCARICEWSGSPWMLENPVGVLSTYWRKPDYTFQPWNFGDMESKKTCLWTGGAFVMPEFENVTKPDGVKESTWKMPPSAERGDLRSVTFPGFAEAVFRANSGRLAEEA